MYNSESKGSSKLFIALIVLSMYQTEDKTIMNMSGKYTIDSKDKELDNTIYTISLSSTNMVNYNIESDIEYTNISKMIINGKTKDQMNLSLPPKDFICNKR